MEEKPKIVISIVYDPDAGTVNINGPLENELLCYGLLEKAKILVTDWKLQHSVLKVKN